MYFESWSDHCLYRFSLDQTVKGCVFWNRITSLLIYPFSLDQTMKACVFWNMIRNNSLDSSFELLLFVFLLILLKWMDNNGHQWYIIWCYLVYYLKLKDAWFLLCKFAWWLFSHCLILLNLDGWWIKFQNNNFSNHGNVDPPIKKMEKKKSCAGVADIRSFFKRK